MPRDIISDSQFASNDGGSRRLSDKSKGPDSGYYVARDPDVPVSKGGSYEDVVTDADAGEVKAHFDLANEAGARHAGTPYQSPDEVYQGSWPNGGKRYLDVSDRYSESTKGLMHALQHGMQNAQMAAWAAHNPGKEEVTITSTENDQKAGHPLGVRYVANALHAQEVQRAAASRSKPVKTKNQREAGL